MIVAVSSMCSVKVEAIMGEMQEPVGVLKICLKKEFLSENTEEKQYSLKVRSSKMRSKTLSTGTNVNKLTTSKKTKISFLDFAKF